MQKYLALYIGTATAEEKADWESLPENERIAREQALMEAWGHWMGKNHAAIVDGGSALGATKRAALKGVEDTSNQITGYILIEAASHDAAAEMFKDHPHCTLSPGNWVEVIECLSIPDMSAEVGTNDI